jgi:hypothetical protein
MSRLRFRDDEGSNTTTILAVLAGAVGGFALGMFVAQRVGGLEGLTSRLKKRMAGATKGQHRLEGDADEFDDIEEDGFEDDVDQELEERVLEAFRNDPILAERAVDIGSIGTGSIELAGWVDDQHEAEHAVTIARGVPGVETVVNRLAIGSDEDRIEETARRAARGDAAFSERHWDGNTIGTGRRRQGNSDELDRHVDPKVELESRLASKEVEDDDVGSGHRRRGGKSASAPDSVAKAD